MTKNLIIQTTKGTQDFEEQMNIVNNEYGQKVFATQTHVTVVGPDVLYTAVFFVRE